MEVATIFAIATAACEIWHHVKPILMGFFTVVGQ